MTRVLVVDDQPHILRVIRMALAGKGYEVDIARDGALGLQALQRARYDVLITDVQMPNMDGVELCERMHTELPAPHPYTLMVTASTEETLRDWVATRGDVEFLEKPISLRRLCQRLGELFSVDASLSTGDALAGDARV